VFLPFCLSVCVSIFCLSVFLPFCLSVCVSIFCLSMFLPFCLPVCASTFLFLSISTFLFVYLFSAIVLSVAYLPIIFFVNFYVDTSLHLFILLLIVLFDCPSVYLFICISVCFLYVNPSFHLSICLAVYLHFPLSVFPLIHLSVYLSYFLSISPFIIVHLFVPLFWECDVDCDERTKQSFTKWQSCSNLLIIFHCCFAPLVPNFKLIKDLLNVLLSVPQHSVTQHNSTLPTPVSCPPSLEWHLCTAWHTPGANAVVGESVFEWRACHVVCRHHSREGGWDRGVGGSNSI